MWKEGRGHRASGERHGEEPAPGQGPTALVFEASGERGGKIGALVNDDLRCHSLVPRYGTPGPREPHHADARPRHTLRQHDSNPLDGRGAAGEFRPPRNAHGHGPRGLRALATTPPLRPERPRLAGPRPVRAVDGPRFDAALLDAPPGRAQAGEPEARDPRAAV